MGAGWLTLMVCGTLYNNCPSPEIQAQGGAWLDRASLLHALEIDDDFKLCTQKLKLDQEAAGSWEAERQALKQQGAAMQDSLEAMQKRVADVEKRDDELHRQLDAWYRNPVVVGALGFAVGALSGGILVTVVQHHFQ